MKFPRCYLAVFMGVAAVSCQSPKLEEMPPMAPASTLPARTESADLDSVTSIAHREVIRRQEAIRQMDEAALRASQSMANDDLEGAVSGYRRAVNGMP